MRTHGRHAHNILEDPSHILHPEYQLLPSAKKKKNATDSAGVKAPASSFSYIHNTIEQNSRLMLDVENRLRSTVVLVIMILWFYGFTITTLSFLIYLFLLF